MNPDAVRQRIYRAKKAMGKVREPSMNPGAVRKRIYRAKKNKEKELAAVATINNGRGRSADRRGTTGRDGAQERQHRRRSIEEININKDANSLEYKPTNKKNKSK